MKGLLWIAWPTALVAASCAPQAQPVAAPTSDLCTATHTLHFSTTAINAMDQVDLNELNAFNRTHVARCGS